APQGRAPAESATGAVEDGARRVQLQASAADAQACFRSDSCSILQGGDRFHGRPGLLQTLVAPPCHAIGAREQLWSSGGSERGAVASAASPTLPRSSRKPRARASDRPSQGAPTRPLPGVATARLSRPRLKLLS
ncbi:unnamed protein product, partial [Polarella glacialis]